MSEIVEDMVVNATLAGLDSESSFAYKAFMSLF